MKKYLLKHWSPTNATESISSHIRSFRQSVQSFLLAKGTCLELRLRTCLEIFVFQWHMFPVILLACQKRNKVALAMQYMHKCTCVSWIKLSQNFVWILSYWMSPQHHTSEFPTINNNNVVDVLTFETGANLTSVMSCFKVTFNMC